MNRRLDFFKTAINMNIDFSKFGVYVFVMVGIAALSGIVITRDDGPKWRWLWKPLVAMYKGYIMRKWTRSTSLNLQHYAPRDKTKKAACLRQMHRDRRIAQYLYRHRKSGFPRGVFYWLRNYCPSWFIRKISSCPRCAPLWLGALPAYIAMILFPQSIYILLPLACVGYAYAIEGMAGVI